MTPDAAAEDVPGGDLRQGDVVVVDPLGSSGAGIGLDAEAATSVTILSQTCDVIQTNKTHCLVAPVINASAVDISAARTGKKPLLLYLDDGGGSGPWVADIGRAFSIEKKQLLEAQRVGRVVESASSSDARRLGARIGRAFGRFPFPDEVYPVFSKLQDRLRAKAGTAGNLGRVIDLVEEIRVSADQWGTPGRHLRLHVIVFSELLIPDDDADPAWSWARVVGWTAQDGVGHLTLDRVCELLLANIDGDRTSLLHLWREFGQSLHTTLIAPYLSDEVVAVDVEVVSDVDFSYFDVKRSESLDLETLSDSASE